MKGRAFMCCIISIKKKKKKTAVRILSGISMALNVRCISQHLILPIILLVRMDIPLFYAGAKGKKRKERKEKGAFISELCFRGAG